MPTYHGTDLTQYTAYSSLQEFVDTSRAVPGSFEEFERALGEQMRALENELKAEQLARYDIDALSIVVAGERRAFELAPYNEPVEQPPDHTEEVIVATCSRALPGTEEMLAAFRA
jgi:hypothetical protein